MTSFRNFFVRGGKSVVCGFVWGFPMGLFVRGGIPVFTAYGWALAFGVEVGFLSMVIDFLVISFTLDSYLSSSSGCRFDSSTAVRTFNVSAVRNGRCGFAVSRLGELVCGESSLPMNSSAVVSHVLVSAVAIAN